MSLLTLVIALVLVGVLLWGVNYVPWIDPKLKQIINVVVVICVIVYLLQAFGLLRGIGSVRVPQVQ